MKRIAFATSLIAIVLAASPLAAQPVKIKEEKKGLLKLATVTPEAATATAAAAVPNGKIQAAEIEQEDGKLVYSFDIKVAGKSGIQEVNIDAKSGAVLSNEHESPADEAKEAKADKAKAAAAAKPKPKPPAK